MGIFFTKGVYPWFFISKSYDILLENQAFYPFVPSKSDCYPYKDSQKAKMNPSFSGIDKEAPSYPY
ncbi:MAG TPA: hypothetical protein DCY74_04885 [Clostridiales bacterium]|jgi:hypothetical protein|nr:hypothetical protein [Clostridiales bacterium]HCG34852.1 hypothetical protein [Clostridiales bacterium]